MSETYIVLYHRDPYKRHPSYHWTVGVTEGKGLSDGIYEYQVVDMTGKWEHRFEANPPVRVHQSELFHLAIYIGTISATADDIKGFASESPSNQHDTQLLSTHVRWSCSLWAIRLLHDLQAAGVFEGVDLGSQMKQEDFYRRILAIANLASTAAHAPFRIIAGDVTRVVHYNGESIST